MKRFLYKHYIINNIHPLSRSNKNALFYKDIISTIKKSIYKKYGNLYLQRSTLLQRTTTKNYYKELNNYKEPTNQLINQPINQQQPTINNHTTNKHSTKAL